MPRTCTICTHPQREAIDQALIGNESFRRIATQFSVSEASARRHKTDHIPAHLAKAREAAEITQAGNLTAELKRIMARVNLLFDACDRWLRDPDNPEQYDVGPRAEDFTVVYLEPAGDKMVRRKARLSELLPRVESQGLEIKLVEFKHADPRKLLLETSERLRSQLELLAKLLGELQEGQTINILISPQWQNTRTILVQALAPYPEARIAVAEALLRIEGNGIGSQTS